MKEYHDAFVEESTEQITDLNNALLALESDADDQEAMDDVFRVAHTLKGNAGAMGFDDIGEVAHALEDLLDEIRNDRMAVTPDVMDLAFAGVDHIETALAHLDDDGGADADHDDLVSDIRDVIRENDQATDGGDQATDGDGQGTDGGGQVQDDDQAGDSENVDDADSTTDPALSPDGFDIDVDEVEEDVLHAELTLGESEMKGVDAMLVFDALSEDLSVLDSRPDREAIEDGDYDDSFDLVLSGTDAEAAESLLAAVGSVEEAAVSALAVQASAEDGSEADPAEDTSTDERANGSTGGGSSSVDDVKSVRVNLDQLDDLHGQVEQLVTSRIKLRRALTDEDVASAQDALGKLDKISSSLQDTVMDMQLIPLKKVVGKFPRLVRDLARTQDKEIDFRMQGEDIELDRTILTQMDDPLLHILRNAVDHGIEPPGEREAAGKPREGTIELRARREGDHVLIEVEDDGGGLEVAAIREKAEEKGVRSAEELDRMDDSEVYDLVFHPGFSTSEEVTDVSGRGVGMDVVHSTVTQLDGSVSVDSTLGEGTTVTLRLPVTVAIVTVLFVRVGDRRFGIPIKTIDEISRATGVKTVNQGEVVEHGEDLYPVVHLSNALEVPDPRATNGDGMLVCIRESERAVALYCDAVEDQEEVVVKPMEGILAGIEGVSGTAVLGDGKIVPILDVVTL